MAMLTKNDIFKSVDRKTVVVDMTKEWGGEIKLMSMSFKDTEEYEKTLKKGVESDTMFELVFISCVDDEGNRLFTTDEDKEFLRTKDANSLLKVFLEAHKLNKIETGKLEEDAKN